MKIDICERGVTSGQCETIVRSAVDTVTQTMNYRDETAYDVTVYIKICKSLEDTEDDEFTDLKGKIDAIEAQVKELAIFDLNERLSTIMPMGPTLLPPKFFKNE